MASAIKLTIGDNLSRKPIVVDADKTPKQIISSEGRDINLGYWMLDGGALSTQEMNTPLGELLNGSETATLLQVVKANNA